MFTSTDYDNLLLLMSENPKARVLLEKLLSSQEEAVASISHEIRNPLTLVYSCFQLLEKQHPDIAADPHWTSMQNELEYMNHLLADLSVMNHSRTLSLSEFSFRSFMEKLVLSFAASCADGDIEFTSRLAEDLPFIRGDAVKLREVFLNLLQNARESISGKGCIRLDAFWSTSGLQPDGTGHEKETPGIVVTIADSGCGISEDQLPHIFEPFTTYKKGGTGLGLSIARSTVAAHGGRITVRSSAGTGTEFTVFLPAQKNRQYESGG